MFLSYQEKHVVYVEISTATKKTISRHLREMSASRRKFLATVTKSTTLVLTRSHPFTHVLQRNTGRRGRTNNVASSIVIYSKSATWLLTRSLTMTRVIMTRVVATWVVTASVCVQLSRRTPRFVTPMACT